MPKFVRIDRMSIAWWRESLRRYISTVTAEEIEESGDPGDPILKPPATQEAIRCIESQIGAELSAELRLFYSVTNGLGRFSNYGRICPIEQSLDDWNPNSPRIPPQSAFENEYWASISPYVSGRPFDPEESRALVHLSQGDGFEIYWNPLGRTSDASCEIWVEIPGDGIRRYFGFAELLLDVIAFEEDPDGYGIGNLI